MSERISFGDALKKILHSFSSGTDEEIESKDDKEIGCPSCENHMMLYREFSNDFVDVFLYKCNNCGGYREYIYDVASGDLMKEVKIYKSFTNDCSGFTEALSDCSYNGFALDRLWLICGVLCYPVLCKSATSDSIDLVFVSVDDDVFHNKIEGFILTDNNIIGRISYAGTNALSIMTNPYIAKLPHKDFLYVSVPTIRSESIETVEPIRFRHKIKSCNNGASTVHELTIIEDFGLECFGIEIYIKFLTYTSDDETDIRKIIKAIDLESLILGGETHIDDDYYIQTSRLSKINLYSLTTSKITKELRIKFYKDIKRQFELVS